MRRLAVTVALTPKQPAVAPRVFRACVLVFACSFAACGPRSAPSASPADPKAAFDFGAERDVSLHYRAGKRIRPRWRVTNDGARELVALHDVVLDLDCKFTPTVSGLRCVPDPDGDDGLSFQDLSSSFRDEACTQPVAWAGDLSRRKFIVARDESQSECPGAPVRVYRAATIDVVTTVYLGRKGGSRGSRVSSEGGFGVATLGAEITSQLATGNLRVVRSSTDRAGIAVAYVESDDGAIAFDHWVDTRHDARCTFRTAADGVARCLPDGPPTVFFADEACEVPSVSTLCSPPRFFLRLRSDCSDRFDVLRGGPPTTQREFVADGEECSKAFLTTKGAITYSSTGEISASSLVGIDRSPRASSGHGATRLRANDVAVGALRMRSPREMPWHDTKLDVDCEFKLAADGVMRCLPDIWLPVSVNAFTDPACSAEAKELYAPHEPPRMCEPTGGARSIPAEARYRTSAILPKPPAAPRMHAQDDVRDVRFRVEELAPRPSATPLYVPDGRRCTAVPAAELLRVRASVRELAPATFEASCETE